MKTKTLMLLAMAASFQAGNCVAVGMINGRFKIMHEKLEARKDREKFVQTSLNELLRNLATEFPSPEAQQHLVKFQKDLDFIQEFYG